MKKTSYFGLRSTFKIFDIACELAKNVHAQEGSAFGGTAMAWTPIPLTALPRKFRRKNTNREITSLEDENTLIVGC
jgi:hypothetical protein